MASNDSNDELIIPKVTNIITPTEEYNSIINNSNDGFNSDLFKRLKRSQGLYASEDFKDWNYFYRWKRMDPHHRLGTTQEYVFFTKPDLNIFPDPRNLANINEGLQGTIIEGLLNRGASPENNRYINILKNLQWSTEPSNPFIKAFTNKIRSSIDLPGISANDQETAQNQFGTKIMYRKSTIATDDDQDFTTEFEDTKYLDIYLWLKCYDEYERRKFKGEVGPNDKYIKYRVLHDQMAVFKFIVGENGRDILFWSRRVGVYPKTVNRDAFSEVPADGNLKITCNWHASFTQDMDVDILYHFNHISQEADPSNVQIEVYDAEINAITGEDMIAPRILARKDEKNGIIIPTLEWVPKNRIKTYADIEAQAAKESTV